MALSRLGTEKEAPAGLHIQALHWETEILYRTWGQPPVTRLVPAPRGSLHSSAYELAPL